MKLKKQPRFNKRGYNSMKRKSAINDLLKVMVRLRSPTGRDRDRCHRRRALAPVLAGRRRCGVVRGLRSNGVHDVLEIEDDLQAAQPHSTGDGAAPRAFLLPLVADYVDQIESQRVPAIDAAGGERLVRVVRVDWDRSWN